MCGRLVNVGLRCTDCGGRRRSRADDWRNFEDGWRPPGTRRGTSGDESRTSGDHCREAKNGPEGAKTGLGGYRTITEADSEGRLGAASYL